MAFNLKLPKFLAGSKATKDQVEATATIVDDSSSLIAQKSGAGAGPLSEWSVTKKLQVLGIILILVMGSIGAVVYYNNRESSYNTAYVAAAGEMQMLSQRLAKASAMAPQGEQWALIQLLDSHSKFTGNLERLTNGGVLYDQRVPPSPANVQPKLQELNKIWDVTNKNANQLLAMQKSLVVFGIKAFAIREGSIPLFDLSEQVADLKLKGNSGGHEVAAANQLGMLTQRIAKNVSELRIGNDISPEVAQQLGKDTKAFNELLTGLIKVTPGESETGRKLDELRVLFKNYNDSVNVILDSMKDLVVAKQAGTRIFRESEGLLAATDSLAQGYQSNIAERTVYRISLAVLIVLALGALALMAKIYLEDERHQAELAEKSRLETEAVNRQNQDAILRLMNELGNLADGDLTVTATVSEDITGAIADSINYTVEELRVLVGRINDAAGRVTAATEIAQQTSAELLDAARRQSQEIQQAGHSVLEMASSMSQVSGEADQSAQVARQSLAAASKGTLAVQDSIKGMNEIREQIQETSKRIKRLGESSQEIGEIVELISDITEQTNVLALNAAIQAASAGDAGRGITVVAEEVQRLAERSGEATKQIAAIVKTIQTDTQGAVSAMEESTRGVVEGAKLSDAAGQALAEIGDVSQNLAELIDKISAATRQQADSATGVAGKMQDILRVTEQTTAGTQKTASAVGELAGLATELKGSVAGFKVG